MTSKTLAAPTIADFDDWTDADEEAAIRRFAGGFRVRHVIKNDEYWALAPGGHIYKLPLALNIEAFESLSSASDVESIASIKGILAAFAGEEQARQLEAEPLQVVFNLLQDYGTTLSRTQGVSDLGKSTDSASSSAPTTV